MEATFFVAVTYLMALLTFVAKLRPHLFDYLITHFAQLIAQRNHFLLGWGLEIKIARNKCLYAHRLSDFLKHFRLQIKYFFIQAFKLI